MFEEIMKLFEERNYTEMKSQLNEMHAPDVAILLEEVAEESQKNFLILFRLLNKELAAETFVEMSTDNQEYLINTFSDAELKSVFEELFVDDTVDIIEEMPANVVKRILNQSDAETRQYINQILKYPEDSAGSLMTVEYVSLKKHWTVKECFDRIRKVAVTSSDNPEFNEFMDAFCSPDGLDAVRRIVDEKIKSTSPAEPQEEEN